MGCLSFLLQIIRAEAFRQQLSEGVGTVIVRTGGQKDPERIRIAKLHHHLTAHAAWRGMDQRLPFRSGHNGDAAEAALSFADCFEKCGALGTVAGGIGGVFNVMSMVLSNLIRSVGYSKEAGIGISFGGVLNMILDPILMFWIFPDGMQVTGAAVATMLSNVITFSYFVIICIKIQKNTVIGVSLRQGLPERSSIIEIFSVGIPAGVSVLLFDIANMIANKKMAIHGDTALAAYGIVTKVERLPLNIGIGICLGMIPLIAYNYAAKNRERVKQIFNCARILGVTIAVLCVIFYHSFSAAIITFFIGDAETIQLGTAFLQARCFATPFMFLCFNMVHYFNAIGRGKISFWLAVVRQIVFNIPIMLILNNRYGAYGLVWTQLIADVCTVVVSYVVYFWVTRKMK